MGNSAYWTDCLFGYLPKITEYVPQTHGWQLIFLENCSDPFPDDQVLIFSQWTKVLDIMDYYFSEKGFEVCRIDGNVKLEERRRQVSPVLMPLLHFKQYSDNIITTRSLSHEIDPRVQ